MEKKLRLVVLACLASLVFVIPPAAQAADFICVGRPPAGTVIKSDVVVPSGALCELLDVKVLGNVRVQPGGNLRLGDDIPVLFETVIFGNVESNAAGSIRFGAGNVGTFLIEGNAYLRGTTGTLVSARNFICNGTINGDLRVEDSTPAAPFQIGSGPVGCADAMTIRGTVEITRNAATVEIQGLLVAPLENHIFGNVYVFDNTATVTINGNRIEGNLKCRNTPVIKGVNIIEGNDECPVV